MSTRAHQRFFPIITFCILMLAHESAFAEKIDWSKRFEVQWQSVQYHHSLTKYNPKIRKEEVSEHQQLSLSCQVMISNPHLILGISESAAIDSIIPTTLLPDTSKSRSRPRNTYRALEYRERFQRANATFAGKVKSLLNLNQSPPQRIRELQPSTFRLDLNVAEIQSRGPQIDKLSGSVYALVADAIEAVDIPFEPNDQWQSITSNLEILIEEAHSADQSYRYRIKSRNPLDQQNRGYESLEVNSFLPNQLVIEQQLINADQESVHGYNPRRLPPHIGGNGSGSGGKGPVKTIRYRIAIRPHHIKIPFALDNIALPEP